MAVLYPKSHYNEACYKRTALYFVVYAIKIFLGVLHGSNFNFLTTC